MSKPEFVGSPERVRKIQRGQTEHVMFDLEQSTCSMKNAGEVKMWLEMRVG